ncbi:MAG: acyl-CoA dehydrogenase family protein [Burkholderiaceae bacterium]
MIEQALERILRDHCSGADVRRIEQGGSTAVLGRHLKDAGFLELLVAPGDGGAPFPLPESFAVFACLGRFGMPMPLAHSMAARALVDESARLPTGMLTLASVLRREEDGSVVCPQAPCGGIADHVLACEGDALYLLSAQRASRQPVGDPRSLQATLHWPDESAMVPVGHRGGELLPFAAALTAAMLSGAMHRIMEMTLDYCNQRVQFGKALGKFQAIQQQLSVMAEHVLAAGIAAECAFRTTSTAPSLLAAAVAKSRTSEAAGLVAATAHAVHGAMGMTDECDLGLLTRRLHEWRIAYGAEHYWNTRIGEQMLGSADSVLDFALAV